MSLVGIIGLTYVLAAVLFVVGLKMLSSPVSARKGNALSAVGMLLAIVATLLDQHVVSYHWILVGILLGTVAGILAARLVAMTKMPEMVALLNGFGGIASLLVAWAVYLQEPGLSHFTALTVFLSVLIGGVTFSGSLVAYLKLAETISGKPLVFKGQHLANASLLLGAVLCGVFFTLDPQGGSWIFAVTVVISLLLGVMSVIPIGGADMPVVISLLNSYSGLAACATGFVIVNNILIVSGALVGASGIILTGIMCRAMNRSLGNVLFSGFGATTVGVGQAAKGVVKALSPEDAYLVLEAAASVIVVPGYGLAVSQAQHVVRELGELLEANGCEVRYAIHPVAGRMPGHMNVLLAEANVPYDQLVEMDAINPAMPTVDVAIVIGANDVVNPQALNDPSSPIYGMPIIKVHEARTVFVLKRSMAAGFAGIDNPLFFADNTRMIFGDAKKTISSLIAEFKKG